MKDAFLNRMKLMLEDEYPSYLETLEQERYRGIRVNTLKCDIATCVEQFPYPLISTPFCEEAFYLDETSTQIGNLSMHIGGAFYMQEPSATSAVTILDVKEGDWVLDLCAAPGGKSTQIAAKLNHTGFLLSNEIEGKRAQILLSNLERIGASQNMITNAHPKELCTQSRGWFDKVLVDAPCSGEGMFKKHSAAMEDWSEAHVKACANRQIQILQSAYEALKEGGILVYSTCTYALEENEQVVAQFLREFPDMKQVDCDVTFGRVGYDTIGMDASKVRRIFPMDKGEGHFVAKFQKRGQLNREQRPKGMKSDVLPQVIASQLQAIVELPQGYYRLLQDKVYYKQTPFLQMGKIKVLREGILCGEIIKNRLEPHQHLFMAAITKPYIKRCCSLDDASQRMFISGNQIALESYLGYTACMYKNLVLGFGKGDGNVIKNKYPKGLRRNL